jgi:hypothetical protein
MDEMIERRYGRYLRDDTPAQLAKLIGNLAGTSLRRSTSYENGRKKCQRRRGDDANLVAMWNPHASGLVTAEVTRFSDRAFLAPMKKTILALAMTAALAAPLFAANDADMEAAKSSLQTARERLQAAKGDRDYDGHRQHALTAVNNALEHVNAALKLAGRQENKDQKKVNSIDKQINQLEKRKTNIENH